MAARLRENVAAVRQQQLPVPADADVTQPYWLREDEAPGMFHVAPRDTALIGSPENPPPLRVKEHFVVDGHDLWITSPVQRITAYPDRGEVRTDVHLVPSVSLSFPQPVALVAPGAGATITVRVTPNQGRAQGKLRLRAEGNAEPLVTVPFDVAGAAKTLQLHLPASDTGAGAHPGATLLSAEAVIDGRVWDTDRIVIRYPHIPDQLLQPRARMRLLTLDLKVTARRVGYVSGAGDSVADALTRMGCAVLPLRPDELTEDRLRGLDALVFGVRAFNTQAALPARLDAVFAYIAAGGTVVVQYNTPNELKTTRLGPYPLHLNRNLPHHRITDERSPITFLLPDSPALNVPNRIGPEDFQGWVQERGLNFPDAWDEHYQALLSSFDPGEAPQKSALLVAAYGKGHYVYTGLSFFRQLPAGVPGAYRLFANLISLGHD